MTTTTTSGEADRSGVFEATRVAYLVEGEVYFKALVAAMVRAERSIRIVGWDLDARAGLPDPWRVGSTISLRRLVNRLAKRRKALRIHLLGWDFSAVLALDRPPLAAHQLDWRTHDRVKFFADGVHPAGASHHQNVAVIDDRIAFVGGTDLAIQSRDARPPTLRDPRRFDPIREPHPPLHDVQLVVSGPVAEALGDLTRARWRRATGDLLSRVTTTATDPWPKNLTPDAEGAIVEISTTHPAADRSPSTKPSNVESSFVDQIASARRAIYVENQYFSCPLLAAALARRLDEPDGPEVVLVASRSCAGWLDPHAMTVLRQAFLSTLRQARFANERLRAVAPFVNDAEVAIHAKVLVIDDSAARVGSASWSRRSQTLDTECDATVHGTSPATRAAVRSLRDRLLAEHLGLDLGEVESELSRHGSIVRLVDAASIGRGRRHVRRLEDLPPSPEDVSWLESLGDPERPLDAPHLAVLFARHGSVSPKPFVAGWMKIVAAATMSLLLALLVLVVAR